MREERGREGRREGGREGEKEGGKEGGRRKVRVYMSHDSHMITLPLKSGEIL